MLMIVVLLDAQRLRLDIKRQLCPRPGEAEKKRTSTSHRSGFRHDFRGLQMSDFELCQSCLVRLVLCPSLLGRGVDLTVEVRDDVG